MKNKIFIIGFGAVVTISLIFLLWFQFGERPTGDQGPYTPEYVDKNTSLTLPPGTIPGAVMPSKDGRFVAAIATFTESGTTTLYVLDMQTDVTKTFPIEQGNESEIEWVDEVTVEVGGERFSVGLQ
jgi:hypothetical protein